VRAACRRFAEAPGEFARTPVLLEEPPLDSTGGIVFDSIKLPWQKMIAVAI
jgi:hypothetical protein